MLFHKDIHFVHHEVASLAWAIGSPPLLHDDPHRPQWNIMNETWCDEQFSLHREWLLELDRDPSTLLAWLVAENQKLLGKRFESLLAFWFSHSPHFTLLHRNIQLRQDGNTSGEIDFVVKLADGKVIHIETACKYYLGAKSSAQWGNWIGPNGHDNLALKMEKLSAQLSIFGTSAGKDFLQQHGLTPPASFTFLKGYFFHHYRAMTKHTAPRQAHPHYSSGWYLHEMELGDFESDTFQWLMLPKSHWMGTYDFALNDFILLDGKSMVGQCREHLKQKRKAPMLIQVMMEDGIAREISRGFVVSNQWPRHH